mmetsp:Transcript_91279/g.164821  ORF Transcript_91279/g.164821 Transcript_91279/m.164821 type:complete len:224 (-) Transcript_91279:149-820(-)
MRALRSFRNGLANCCFGQVGPLLTSFCPWGMCSHQVRQCCDRDEKARCSTIVCETDGPIASGLRSGHGSHGSRGHGSSPSSGSSGSGGGISHTSRSSSSGCGNGSSPGSSSSSSSSSCNGSGGGSSISANAARANLHLGCARTLSTATVVPPALVRRHLAIGTRTRHRTASIWRAGTGGGAHNGARGPSFNIRAERPIASGCWLALRGGGPTPRGTCDLGLHE